ncbi:MAG: TrkA family potassium uptake protein [Halobaculum sp.]
MSITEFPRDPRALHPRNLTGRQRLVAVYLLGLAGLVGVFTVTYHWGVTTLEGRDRSLFQALNVVIETMTTTGYGADSPWQTPAMNLLIVTMQLSGVLIGFVALRVLVIPLFENAPLNLDDRLTPKDDHVVVAEYRRDSEELLDELDEWGIDYVLLESDVEEAKRLSDAGYQALDGDPEEAGDLERASIRDASLLITDAEERTASVVLTALEANPDLRVVSFTASTRRKAALSEIGVDRSVAPHALIGEQLAEKATTPVVTEDRIGLTDDAAEHGEAEVDGEIDPEDDRLDPPGSGASVVVREVLVRRGSPLHGVRVADSPLARHPDVTLVAGWFDGELRVSPPPDTRLTPNAVLVVAGPEEAITALSAEVGEIRRSVTGSRSRVVVAGLDEGGRAAVETLPEEVTVTTVDQSPEREPDVVGDVTEPETLTAADLAGASALIVTVDDDATALLAIAMARSVAPDVEILARVTDSEKAGPAFRAGADYVLSVQRVSARLVAAEVRGERVVSPVGQIRLVRAAAASFAGESLASLRATDAEWTVVGAVRDGRLVTGADVRLDADDELFVAGSDEAVGVFERTAE